MIFKSLKTRMIISMTGIVVISLAITTFFLIQRTKHELALEIEENAKNLIKATTNQVESQYNSIVYHKNAMLERREKELKNNTIIAYTILTSAYQEYIEGIRTEQNAKELAIKCLRELTYDDGVGYFWLNNTQLPYPKMVMHPTMPELDGTVLDAPQFNCALGKNENLFKAAVEMCIQNKDGYVDYLWPKPLPDSLSELQPKISYVKLFEPWGWIIGTGVYINDIEQDVQDRLNAVIADLNETMFKQKIGKSGYFFIQDDKDLMIVHPSLAGQNISQKIDPLTGEYLSERIKKTILNNQDYIEYYWDKPGYEGKYNYLKRVYVSYFEPLGWYICISVYKEENQERITALVRSIILFALFFTIIAIFLSLLITKSLNKPLNKFIDTFSETDSDGIPIKEIPEPDILELKVLANTTKNMFSTISKSRKALRISETKFRALVESTSDWIWEVDRNGVFTYASPQIYNISGYTPEEVVSLKPIDFMDPEEGKRIQDLLEIIMTNKHNIIMEENISRHKNGKMIIYETSGVPILDENGDVTGYRAVSRDITARKISEQALKQEQEITEAAINSQKDTFFLFETETGKAIRWNHVFSEITGYTNEEIAKMKVPDAYYSQNDLEKLPPIEKHILKSGTGIIELELICKDGRKIPTEYNISVIRDENNQPKYFVSIGRDITERKLIEDKIKRDLKEKEVMLREIHHRVKNNLAVITGLLYLQSKRIKSKKEAFSAFEQSRNRIFSMALVHEQLYQSGNFSQIDMKPYVEKITNELRQIISYGNQIDLNININDVYLDINQAVPCGLILNELITNAYKHAFPRRKKGVILITFKPVNDEQYELTVEDDGIGLGKDIDANSNATLGIHLVAMLTKQIDGSIDIERDNGTKFLIRFNAKQEKVQL